MFSVIDTFLFPSCNVICNVGDYYVELIAVVIRLGGRNVVIVDVRCKVND